MTAPLDLDAIRRDADRMLTAWQQIQNARRPSMITDYLLFVEQSAEDVPPLVRYVTTLLGEVERLTSERDAAAGQRDRYRVALDSVFAERDAARAEAERLRQVVDAARRAVNDNGGKDPWDALVAAVDAYEADAPVEPERNEQEPCDTCSGAGCAECEPLPERTDRWLATWSITGSVEQVVEHGRAALTQMASDYADAGPVKLRAELREDGGEPR